MQLRSDADAALLHHAQFLGRDGSHDAADADAMFLKKQRGISSECRSGTELPRRAAGESFYACKTESGYRRAVPASHFSFFFREREAGGSQVPCRP